MDALGEALQTTVSRWKCKFSAPLPLELYTSSNFIGLFVKEDSAEVLKKFAADFAAEAASKTGESNSCQAGSPGSCYQKVGKTGDRKLLWKSGMESGGGGSYRNGQNMTKNTAISCSIPHVFASFQKY